MNTADADAKYWCVVEECLVQLHGLSREDAETRWQDYRRRLEENPLPGLADSVYHDEPLYVANDLAGRDLDDRAVDATYRAIQERFWPRRHEHSDAASTTQA